LLSVIKEEAAQEEKGGGGLCGQPAYVIDLGGEAGKKAGGDQSEDSQAGKSFTDIVYKINGRDRHENVQPKENAIGVTGGESFYSGYDEWITVGEIIGVSACQQSVGLVVILIGILMHIGEAGKKANIDAEKETYGQNIRQVTLHRLIIRRCGVKVFLFEHRFTIAVLK
jgi:hypothetical protein